MRTIGLVILALVIRLGVMVVLGLPPALEPDPEWSWAYEQGAVAQALLRGDGYSDAFASATGPSAWSGPIQPLFLAAAIHLADGINRNTQMLVAVLEALISALIILPLLRLGEGLERPRIGLLAAGLWAVHPLAAYRCVSSPWDGPLVGLLLISFLASLAHAGRGAELKSLVKPGVLLGLAALVNPAALALVPAVAVFLIPRRSLRSAAGALGVLLGTALAVLSPWVIRNALVLGSPALKMNLGVELFVGNNDAVNGNFNPEFHPSISAHELGLYRELGEQSYGDECMVRARKWIANHPRRFAELCLRRMRIYWLGPSPFEAVMLSHGASKTRDWQGWMKWALHFGMGLLGLIGGLLYRDRRGGFWLIAGSMGLYPVVYYTTHVIERYRSPLEPLVTFAVAALAIRVIDRWAQR
ncbi:MAG: hypothetical protein CMJ86_02315 [Planctomycetes bacterium]|nr:hypothetical protein [Planctomycetota bacterium]